MTTTETATAFVERINAGGGTITEDRKRILALALIGARVVDATPETVEVMARSIVSAYWKPRLEDGDNDTMQMLTDRHHEASAPQARAALAVLRSTP